jgi:hypothetical protein
MEVTLAKGFKVADFAVFVNENRLIWPHHFAVKAHRPFLRLSRFHFIRDAGSGRKIAPRQGQIV